MSPCGKLLVIDEETYLLHAFVRLAESAGYRVEGSPDPRAGWDLARRLRPDILLVNVRPPEGTGKVRPPEGTGKHLCQRVKADPVLAHTAIMMLAGEMTPTGPTGAAAPADADVDEYVPKPITSRDLLARVQAMLRVKHSEAQLARIRQELQEKHALLVTVQQQLRTSQHHARQVLPAPPPPPAPAPVSAAEFYETLPVGCCAVDQYGFITAANTLAAQQCGVTRAAFVETLLPDYVADEDVGVFFEHLALAFASQQPQTCDVRLKIPGPQPRAARLDIRRHPAPAAGAGSTIVFTDITASTAAVRQQAEQLEELRRAARLQATLESHDVSQETHDRAVKEFQRIRDALQRDLEHERCRLAAILDSVNDGVTLCDVTGHFDVFNARMSEMTGYSQAEANAHSNFRRVLHPDPAHDQQAMLRLAAVLDSGEPQSGITTIRAKDGTAKTLAVYAARIECGRQVWLLSAYQDITDYRRLKHKLIRSQKRRRAVART